MQIIQIISTPASNSIMIISTIVNKSFPLFVCLVFSLVDALVKSMLVILAKCIGFVVS